MGFIEELDIRPGRIDAARAEASLPITPKLLQPWGFVHGGVTVSLLETAASLGAAQSADPETQLPFGVDVQVRHRKAALAGTLHAVAELDREEPSHSNGVKQFWKVAAYDDAGDVVSEGVILVKIVDRDWYEQRS